MLLRLGEYCVDGEYCIDGEYRVEGEYFVDGEYCVEGRSLKVSLSPLSKSDRGSLKGFG